MIFFFAQHVVLLHWSLHLLAPSEYTCITILYSRLELPFTIFLLSLLLSLSKNPTKKKLTNFLQLAFCLLFFLLLTQETYISTYTCIGLCLFLRRSSSFVTFFSQLSLCVVSYLTSFFRYITYMMHILLLHKKKNDSSTPFPLHQGKTPLLQKKREKKSEK